MKIKQNKHKQWEYQTFEGRTLGQKVNSEKEAEGIRRRQRKIERRVAESLSFPCGGRKQGHHVCGDRGIFGCYSNILSAVSKIEQLSKTPQPTAEKRIKSSHELRAKKCFSHTTHCLPDLPGSLLLRHDTVTKACVLNVSQPLLNTGTPILSSLLTQNFLFLSGI